MEVRTRFAPSPTGSMHVGNARTAIFNWLFARHHGGKFVLRIEDTDVARSTRENEAKLLEDLQWLGIDWDEGPWRQSERGEIYQKYTQQLLDSGHAFYCFCTDEELSAKRQKAMDEKRDPIYDGHCRNLSKAEVEQKLAAGAPYSIRFRVEPQDVIIQDAIKGEVNIKKGMFGDFVIMRSNGMPVYNFAVVVDDGLMNITHIIRAEEHLSNTGRQILLYRALGFPLPVFAHTALILAQDGSKLSKRHGATSVEEYQRRGYLSEALFNFLSILGWTPPEEGKDKLARAEIIKAFGLEKISKSSAKFDNGKLDWLNGEYLKELPLKQMISLLRPYVKNAYDTSVYSEEKLDEILAILAPGLNFLEQVVEESKLFFEAPLSVDEEYQEPLYLKLVARLKEEIQQNPAPDKEFYQELVKNLGKELGLKGKNLFMPIRQYITGQSHGRDLYALMELLGQERLLSRLAAWL